MHHFFSLSPRPEQPQKIWLEFLQDMVGEDAEVQAVHLVLPWDTESSTALHLSAEITRGIDVYSPLSVKKKKNIYCICKYPPLSPS